jgi:ribose-phosphate pyrophosphokinase
MEPGSASQENISRLSADYRTRETSDASNRIQSFDRLVASKVVCGSASVTLGRALARELQLDFVEVAFERHPGGFPDGERYVRLLDSVSNQHVILVQTTWPDSKIVELLLLANAIRDSGAHRVTAVIPYFGYGRQDKRFLEGEPVSARTIAKHLAVDADELLTVTHHNPDILSAFPLPATEVSGVPALARHLKGTDVDMLLAPDRKATRFVNEASDFNGLPFDFLSKQRIDSYTVRVEPKTLKVKGKCVAIVDDVVSTGGTIATAVKELRKQGARRVIAACVHGLFVDGAEANLKACDDVIATDTIQSKYTKVSVAPEIAAAIRALG